MLGAITVLLAIDFFTEITLEISAPIFLSIIIGLILIELIVNRNNRHDAKVNIRSQLFVTAYLVAVIGLFELICLFCSVFSCCFLCFFFYFFLLFFLCFLLLCLPLIFCFLFHLCG